MKPLIILLAGVFLVTPVVHASAQNGEERIILKDDRYPWTLDSRASNVKKQVVKQRSNKAHKVRAIRRARHVTHSKVQKKVVNGSSHLITVATAAGIPITVASSVAQKFVGLIADLVNRGIKPSTIHCFANGGHVKHSLHYWGGACDFNGSASRWAPMN